MFASKNFPRHRLIRRLAATLAVAALLAAAGPAPATPALRAELAGVAGKVKQLLDGQRETAIAVGAFTGPSRLDSSAGPGIAKVLAEELTRLGVTINRRANLEVKGDYLDVQDKRTQLLAALLKVRVLDRSGTALVEIAVPVKDEAALPSLFGLTVQLPPAGDPKGRDQELKKAIDTPRTAIAETRIAAAAGSPYAVEVLVKGPDGLQPRVPKDEGGQAFVPIRRGEAYAVRLINNADHEAAVTLTIDGLNMFTFSDLKDPQTGHPKYRVVFVKPHAVALIRGWHRTNEASDEFLVTEYAKSAAAELKSSAGVGTITASFAAAWPAGARPPADEKNVTRAADATGRGASVQARFTEASRHVGVIRAAVSVRYTKD